MGYFDFDIDLGDVIDNVADFLNDLDVREFLDDLNFGRLTIPDLGGIFKDLGSLVLIGDLNLDDLFDAALDTDFLSLADLFDNLADLGDLGSIDLDDLGDELGDLLRGLGDVNFLDEIDISDLFQGLSLDNLSGLFGNFAISELFDNLGDILGDLDDIDIADALDDLDLLDGLGSVLDSLGNLDILEDWVVLDLNRGTSRGDSLTGSDVGEFILGLAGGDKILGGVANDIINGGKGGDRLFGLQGDDILAGLGGKNVLSGDKGDDILIASGRGDSLLGGRGENWFVFDGNGRNHVVQDFKLGKDELVVTGSINLDRLDITQQGRDALLTVGRNTLAVVKNVDASALKVNDIVDMAVDLL